MKMRIEEVLFVVALLVIILGGIIKLTILL